ncbi:MAG: sigma-70 family RNA polymerase sigma factor [Planctomycetes bacterium]|nr:sigma-70 family RNA polymerase sigma factor [Planctomycetota bacterium]
MKQTRDSEAFLAQLEPLRHQLYGYGRRALNRADAVADVLQEVVLTAWREYPRFVPGTNFRAWVFRIMVNTVFNFNKRGVREQTVPDETAMLDVEAVLEHEAEWSLILDHPDRLRELLDERLVHALDALGASERQCFLLCLLQGFAYKEIAGMLDIPLGTVMSHVHRARMKLRERLASLAIERRYVSEGRP